MQAVELAQDFADRRARLIVAQPEDRHLDAGAENIRFLLVELRRPLAALKADGANEQEKESGKETQANRGTRTPQRQSSPRTSDLPFEGIDERRRDVEAGLLGDLDEAGGTRDVDLGEVAADDV